MEQVSDVLSREPSTEKGKDGKPIFKDTDSIRYFIIKTFTQKHLDISVEKEIWSTQSHNETKLNEAFKVKRFPLLLQI